MMLTIKQQQHVDVTFTLESFDNQESDFKFLQNPAHLTFKPKHFFFFCKNDESFRVNEKFIALDIVCTKDPTCSRRAAFNLI